MYILLGLEMLKVKIILGTLCSTSYNPAKLFLELIDLSLMVKKTKKGNMGVKIFNWGHRDLNPDLPMSVNI